MFYDFPKLESPFVREKVNGQYICVPKIKDEFRWVFTEESLAVDKLDGTNVSLWIRNGKPYAILNRMNEIDIWKKGNARFVQGIVEAIERGYVKHSVHPDGPLFGELIGPKVQGNPYQLKEHVWVPFNYLVEKYCYRFWSSFVEEVKGKSDEEIFNATSDLFKGLWSIYKRNLGIKGEVNENTKFEALAAEGIVFYRNNFGTKEMCKLRRDMFGWFKGGLHKIKENKQ